MIWSAQLAIMLVTGAAVYFAMCALLGIDMLNTLLPRRWRRGTTSAR
jgi:TRAP-type C4-dicarboxylate transport system permease small subunit